MDIKGGRMHVTRASLIGVVLAGALLAAVGCAGGPGEADTLTVYHAGSLYEPFSELEAVFEESHPGVDVLRESGGSAKMVNKVIAREEAGEPPADIVASADYKLIPDRLYERGYAEWYFAFARNSMVLCWRDGAPASEEIASGERTWYDVLLNEPVKYGHSNPDDDPCGYRTPMVIQLAEMYYHDRAEEFGLTPDPNAENLYDVLIPGSEHERGRTGGTSDARPSGSEEVVRSKSVELIHLLDSEDLDYAFEYRSVAVQHGLDFVEFDDHINLSKTGQEVEGIEDFYSQASIEIVADAGPPPTYAEQKGKPIVYGITITSHAESSDLAAEFIELLLSDKGKEIVEDKYGQPCIRPPLCDNPDRLPEGLQEMV
jgi:molybdate/tungstate transport system substrate-binding protein